MATTAELEILIKARDQASRALRNIRGASQRLGDTLLKLGKLAAVGAAAGLVALGVAALKFGSDFQSAFNTIRVGTGATGDELEALNEDFKAVLRTGPESMDKVAASIASLATSSGETGNSLRAMGRNALDAARIMKTEAGPLVDEVGKTIDRMDLKGRDAAKMFDILFVASQETNVPMQTLASTLNAYGPVLTNLGLGLEDQVALMGQLTAAGLDVSRVMPGINAFMRNLAAEGVTDLGAAFQDTIKEIADAKTSTEALNIATEAFGAEGAQRLSVAVRTGTIDIAALTETLKGAEGSIAVTSRETRTWQENLAILKNKVLVKLEPILTKMIDKLTEFTDWLSRKGIPMAEDFAEVLKKELTPVLNTIKTAFEKVRGPAKKAGDVLIKIVKFLDDNREVLAAVAIAIALVLVPAFLKWAFAAVKVAVANFLAVAPLLILIAVIALIVLGIILLIKHWDAVKEAIVSATKKVWEVIKDVWDGILPFLAGVWERIKDLAGIAWEKLKTFLVETAEEIRDKLREAFNKAKDWVIEKVIDLKDGAIEKLKDLLAWVTKLPGRILTALGDLATTLWEKGKELIKGLWDGAVAWSDDELEPWIRGLPGALLKWLGDPFFLSKLLLGVGKDIIGGLWDGMKAIWDDLMAWLSDKLDLIPGFIKDFFLSNSPSRVMDNIGRDLMLGLQGGIETGLKGVIAAVRKVNNALSIEGTVDLAGDLSVARQLALIRREQVTAGGRFPAALGAVAGQFQVGPTGGGVLAGPTTVIVHVGGITLAGSATQQDADDFLDVIEEGLRARTFRRGGR